MAVLWSWRSGSGACNSGRGPQCIREADLKRDLYVMGGDALRGREAGTLDEMRASIWSADEFEKIGLQRPA